MSNITKKQNYKTFTDSIKAVARKLRAIGLSISFFVEQFGIDTVYFQDWISGDIEDFAELVVLYLSPEERRGIITTLNALTADGA